MSRRLRVWLGRSLAGLVAAGAVMLTGCGAGTLAGPSAVPGFKIHGNVHGGAFPIQGATIRLMVTQSNGVWSTTTNTYNGTAQQVLQATSDVNGHFTFPETGWSCAGGQYAYITVTGGHTAVANNFNVVQVGVIGACSDHLANQSEYDGVNVYISELSTVAAAYALGNFISIDNTNASTGQQIVNITAPAANNSTTPGCTGTGNAMTCKHAGLANAFQNAYNLVDQVTYGANQFPTGAARTTLPGNSQATVPQALINTMGNILQSCVDSGGGTVSNYSTYVAGGTGSTHCGDLFYWATPPGSNNPPTNTLQVALNMARYPTNNVDALFKLQPRAVFFTPDMSSDTLSGNSSQYMAYTISIFYLGTGLSGDAGYAYPVDIALDETDNAYVLYSGGSGGNTYAGIDEFQPNGTGVFFGAHQTLIPNPGSLAIDGQGYVWVTNDSATNGYLFLVNTPAYGGTNGNLAGYLYVPGGYAAGVATDMSNNIWVSRDAADGNQSLYRFVPSQGYATTNFRYTPTLSYPSKRVFVDYNQNALGVTSDTNNLGVTNSTANARVYLFPYGTSGNNAQLQNVALSGANGYGIAMSQSDVSYVPVYKQFDTETLVNGNMTANGAGSYTGLSNNGTSYSTPMGVGIDGAGNFIWSDFESAGQIFKFVPSSSSNVSSGTLTSFFPCYPLNGQCYSAVSSDLRGMAIDSSGAIWYLADSTEGVVVQTLGFAAPTYPLLSYARGGVIIQ
jgi:hypothetical protein